MTRVLIGFCIFQTKDQLFAWIQTVLITQQLVSLVVIILQIKYYGLRLISCLLLALVIIFGIQTLLLNLLMNQREYCKPASETEFANSNRSMGDEEADNLSELSVSEIRDCSPGKNKNHNFNHAIRLSSDQDLLQCLGFSQKDLQSQFVNWHQQNQKVEASAKGKPRAAGLSIDKQMEGSERYVTSSGKLLGSKLNAASQNKNSATIKRSFQTSKQMTPKFIQAAVEQASSLTVLYAGEKSLSCISKCSSYRNSLQPQQNIQPEEQPKNIQKELQLLPKSPVKLSSGKKTQNLSKLIPF